VRKPVETRHFFGWDAYEAFELVPQVVLAEAKLIAQHSDGQGAVVLSNLCNGK
jgi:hypothetical protein